MIAGIVVGAILTFVTAGALLPYVAGALTSATVAATTAALATVSATVTTAAALATVGISASMTAVLTAVAGIAAGAIGAIASTTITTGSLSEGLKAGGKALVSGSVKAIVGAAIGFSFASLDLMGTAGTITGTISNIAINTLSGAVASTILGGGSFADNLKSSAISSVITAVADGIGKEFAGAIKEADLGAVGTEVAHGALGCVTGMIRSQSGSGCAPGAAGAVAGHLLAPVIFNTGFDPLGTGTVQGIKDSAVFFSGVVGGAVAAAVGTSDQVNQNYGLGSAAGSNAAENNALAIVARVPDLLVRLANGGWQALTGAMQAELSWCASNPTCSIGLPVAVISYFAVQRVATAPSAADQIPTGYPNAPPPTGGTPPSLISTDNQPNNTGNQNPVTAGGSNNTGGTQIEQPNGPNIVGGGYGAGAGVTINPVTLNLNGQNQNVNLPSIIDSDRAVHILTGDSPTSGGHLWPGQAGKSPFPQSWNADKVLGQISDVATDPISTRATQPNGRTKVVGVREGVVIEVIVEPSNVRNGRIVTAYPANVDRNPK